MKDEALVLISSCMSAEDDADELIRYIDTLNSVDDIDENNLPKLVYELQDKSSSKTQTYIECASVIGGGVASSIGTTLACGALTAGLTKSMTATTIALGSTYGAFAGIGGAIPVLNWLVLPVVSATVILKLIKDSKLKRFKKKEADKLQTKKKGLERGREKLQKFIDKILHELNVVEEKIKSELEKSINEYREKAKKLSETVRYEIENLASGNANERIQKYNAIILNQYKLQRELEEKLDFLYSEYDKLLKEKAELERKLSILMQLLNTMGCPESVINQALAK